MAADGIFLAIPAEPPAGIRLAVKDLLDTAGLTTTYDSAVFAEHVPSTTAESVSATSWSCGQSAGRFRWLGAQHLTRLASVTRG